MNMLGRSRAGVGPWRMIILTLGLAMSIGFYWSMTATAQAQDATPADDAPAATTTPAPTAPPPPAAPSSPLDTTGIEGVEMGAGVPTIAKLFMTSPAINSALLAMSVLALVMFVYLLLSMNNSNFNPPRFIDDVTKLIINEQFDSAVHLCQTNSQVFTAGIIQRIVENRDKDSSVLMGVLDTEGRRRGELIWNRIGYLSEISNIAPMLGLLGTVIGMIKVFFTLTTRTVSEKVGQLSEGIAEAMGTTMFGLVVAIAAGVFYAIIKTQATAVLAEAEHVCHTVADHTHRAANPRDTEEERPKRRRRKKTKATKKRRPKKAAKPVEDDDEDDDFDDESEADAYAGVDDED